MTLYEYRDGKFATIGTLATGPFPAQVVAAELQDDGRTDLVVRNAVLQRLGVQPSSPLPAKLKALKGLSFGITRPGAVTQLFPQYLLRKAGYDPEKDATFVQIGGGQALIAAMKAQKIDAFMLSAPAPYVLERDKVGTVLIKN